MEPADEDRHRPQADDRWHETWTFDAWMPDASVGASTGLVLWPLRNRAWYWASLVRTGEPLVHLVDLDIDPPRVGLEIRSHGLWATHVCEAPFEQWTVANEAYAVALDDPQDALGRAHGTPAPVAFDLEWYASAAPVPLDVPLDPPLDGYRQAGEVHGLIELAGGRLTLEGPATRGHWWGRGDPWPAPDAAWPPVGAHAPVRLEAVALDRVLTRQGWSEVARPL